MDEHQLTTDLQVHMYAIHRPRYNGRRSHVCMSVSCVLFILKSYR